MTSLLDLRTRARSRADMPNSTFVNNSDLNTWLNLGYAELYDIVVSSFERYFCSPTPSLFTIASGNSSPLPANFYKLEGLDYNLNGTWVEVPLLTNFHERNRRSSDWIYSYRFDDILRQYTLMGDTIVITPDDRAIGDYRLFYTPAPTLLVSDSDTLPTSLSKFGWDEYAVLYAAERMLSKEESSITDIQAERAEIANRINIMSANRQVSQSEAVSDVRDLIRGYRRW